MFDVKLPRGPKANDIMALVAAGFLASLIEKVTGIPFPKFAMQVISELRLWLSWLWFPIFDGLKLGDLISRLLGEPYVEIVKDYMSMGLLVLGMRLRSSLHIWRALRKSDLQFYIQRVLFLFPIRVTGTQPMRWSLLFIYRLLEAFILWPYRLVGSASRYLVGDWKYMNGHEIKDEKELAVRREQYLVFFKTLLYALILVAVLVYFEVMGF